MLQPCARWLGYCVARPRTPAHDMHAAKLLLTLAPLWLTTSVLAQELAWHSSLASALDFAKEKNRVMLVAVVMPGERGSDGIIAHYRDSDVRKLSGNCVCAMSCSATWAPPHASQSSCRITSSCTRMARRS